MLLYNFKYGFTFILTAVIFWGILPIALKLSAGFIDPVSLTWFRFLVAFFITLALQYFAGSLRQFALISTRQWIKLSLAAGLSICNYISFVYCLDYLAPGPAQLNFQTAPFFLAFGGVLFFKEKLNPWQMMCFATLALGMMLFFQPMLNNTPDIHNNMDNAVIGILIVQFSAFSWSCYALLQRSLIQVLSPGNILLFIYGFGMLAMAPFCDFSYFEKMQPSQWYIALFCAFNTLIAYGCFAQSMKYWPTTQVGAMVALTPLFSFSFTALIAYLAWWPELIKADSLSNIAIIGITLIIVSVLGVQLLFDRHALKNIHNVK